MNHRLWFIDYKNRRYFCGIKIHMGGDWKKCFTITVISISLVSIAILGIIYIERPVNPYRGVKATCKAEKILAGYIQLLSGTSVNSSKITNVITYYNFSTFLADVFRNLNQISKKIHSTLKFGLENLIFIFSPSFH